MKGLPKYVIINDTDAPEPGMVCQWVRSIGYCYMDRSGTKPRHDGMRGHEATDIRCFGFEYAEDTDRMVRFYWVDRPITATYSDGKPRKWQSHITYFEWRKLTAKSCVHTKERAP